jgi:hypothetical protein
MARVNMPFTKHRCILPRDLTSVGKHMSNLLTVDQSEPAPTHFKFKGFKRRGSMFYPSPSKGSHSFKPFEFYFSFINFVNLMV